MELVFGLCERAFAGHMLVRAVSDGRRAWRCRLKRHLPSWRDVVLQLLFVLLLTAEALRCSCCRARSMQLKDKRQGVELGPVGVHEEGRHLQQLCKADKSEAESTTLISLDLSVEERPSMAA
jgi:hypothetical protein